MKKKVAWLVNLATICLCVCAIVIGVYAVKTATLNVGGTVGFTANNCNVKITSTVKCAENTTDSTAEWKALTSRFIELGAKENSGTANNNQVTKSNTGSLDIGTMNFNDLSDKGNIVEVTFLVENKSAFDVSLTISDMPTLTNGSADMSGVTIAFVNGTTTLTSTSQIKITKGESTTLTVTLTVADILNTDETTLKDAKLNMGLNFEKYVALDAYLASDWGDKLATGYNISGKKSPSPIVGITVSTYRTFISVESLKFTRNLPSDMSEYGSGVVVNTSDSEGEILAYYSSTKKSVIVYSKSTIFAPEDCTLLFTIFADLSTYETALNTIELVNFNTSNVTNMRYMFAYLKNVTEITVSSVNWTTSAVTEDTCMFDNCSSLPNYDVHSYDKTMAKSKDDGGYLTIV